MTPARLQFLLAFAFALAYTQPALYYSNQNQYYLHGAALADVGDLRADWLANTRDPTPLFTALVALAERTAPNGVSWVVFGLLSAIYFQSLWELACAAGVAPTSRGGRLAWAGAVTLLHGGELRLASVQLFGTDYPWYFQAGIANQYLLGAGLQPSAFGVLLLAAVAAWARGRHRVAALALVASSLMHSTYLLPGALIVIGVVLTDWSRESLRFALTTLLGVLPAVGYAVTQFGLVGDPALGESARRLIADGRIPHHGDPTRFLDLPAVLQLHWVALGLTLAWGTRWGRALVVSASLAVSLTLIRIATDSPTLALLFPWRVSVLLVPIATGLTLAYLVQRAGRYLTHHMLGVIGIALLVVALGGAAGIEWRGAAYQRNAAESGVQNFVARNRRPGDVYLLPTKIPDVPRRITIGSHSFVPVAPVSKPFFELQSFRLTTGAAIYADYKSIPYAPADVAEWHRRVKNCERWFAEPEWGAGLIAELRAAGVTHALIPRGTAVESSELREVYRDEWYRVVVVE